MKRLLMGMLLSLTVLNVRAQQTASDEVNRLQARMYKLYSGYDYDEFISVTDSLKRAAEEAGDDRMFYRAWANQVLFSSNRQRRSRAMQIAKEMQDHAIKQGNKWGIYNGLHVSAYAHEQMQNHEEAIRGFKKAVNYLHEYLPNESAASSLIELAKISYLRKHMESAIQYAEQAIHEPHLNALHRLNAYSLMCMSAADSTAYSPKNSDFRADFNRFYAEREKVKEAYGRDDIYGQRVEILKCILSRHFDEALQIATSIRSPLTRYNLERLIYSYQENYEKAFMSLITYMKYKDSISEARNSHLLLEMITSMDVGRLENEQKELKLRNQALQLENLASDLEQERLEEEALQLNLKNKEVELQNAAVRLQNDSLDRHNKNLQISEYESKMAAQEQAARARRIFTTSAIAIATLIILALAYILWRRSLNARRLRRMNDQLQEANTNLKTAYDQLEEATTARERIESELRIARDIQMGMVPSQFPQHSHIDIYGMLKPAKEVGGDLYDFFIQNNKLYFCIGDVSGKGIPASLFMSVIVNLFRMVAKKEFPPEYIAKRLNETVSENNENGMFCTMFIGEIDMQSGKLLYCNAGHNPPVLMADKQDNDTPSTPVFVEMEANAPIGLWPGLVFNGEEIENIKGRPLFLYTDGLSEAENREQLQFGDDRILDVIATQPFTGARQLVERLSESVRQHVGDAPQSDDLTMLCIMCS